MSREIEELQHRAATLLGWSLADAQSVSLPALRDLVAPRSPKLAYLLTEAMRRGYLGRISGKHLDADARDFRAIDRDAADVRRRVKALQHRDHPGRGAGQVLFGAVLGAGAMHLSMKEREKAGRASGKVAREKFAVVSVSQERPGVFLVEIDGGTSFLTARVYDDRLYDAAGKIWIRPTSGWEARRYDHLREEESAKIMEAVEAFIRRRTPKARAGRSAGDDPPRRGDIQRGDLVELPSTVPSKWPHTARVMRIRRGFATLETGMFRYELPVDTLRRAVPTPRPGDKR